MEKKKLLLPSGLIISCQAAHGEPLYNEGIMYLFARCAKAGGAVAIRALCEEIQKIKSETGLPIIGLCKSVYPDSSVYITPTFDEIDSLLKTDCEVIAIDATLRPRPNGIKLRDVVQYARQNAPNRELMADVATIEEALIAEEMGFEYVSTTLRGYTEATKDCSIPDFDFIEDCSNRLHRSRLVVEGGIWEREQLERILRVNPYSVVIGTAVTRPMDITKRFVQTFSDYKG